MIAGVCKFCGCTEATPCYIPASYITDPDFRVAGNVVPCSWLLADVCTAPECVVKAYAEASDLIDGLLADGPAFVPVLLE